MSNTPAKMNPFPGLRPFTQEEDYLFFGREVQTIELLQRLSSNRFVAVVGTSGSGKSSLVRCGLLSELLGGRMLEAGASWEIAVTHPGGNPLAILTDALLEADLYDRQEEHARENLLATLSRSHFGLVEAVKQANLGTRTNFLLVVDQFEEIFRFNEIGQPQQELANEFISLLLEAAAQKEVPIYIVLTMRSDFIGECGQFEGLAEMVNRGEFLIPRLTRDQYKRVIEGPIKVAGGQIAPRLLQRLLNDLGQQADQLPCLQHALMRTWDVWARGEGGGVRGEESSQLSRPSPLAPPLSELDLDDYQRIGKMSQALSLHADEIYESLASDRQRELCRGMFQALTVEESNNRGIRRPQRLGRLCQILEVSTNELLPLINAYRQSGVTFLMPSPEVELTDQTIIDISHESLMRVWTRLRQWVEDETQAVGIYHRLAESSALNQKGKAGLYRDPELGIALAWREANRPNAPWAERYRLGFDAAMAFLDRSREAAEREEKEREASRQRELQNARQLVETQARVARLFKRFAGGLAVGLCLAVALMVWAFMQRQEAIKQEAVADQQRLIAQQSEKEAKQQRLIALESEREAKRQEAAANKQRLIAEEREKEAKAYGLVRLALNVDTPKLPPIIAQMAEYRQWTDPLLRDITEKSPQKFHASLALAPVDPGQADYLLDRLLEADPQTVLPVVRDALAPHKEQVLVKLWAAVEKPEKGKGSQRLRAMSALAKYDPANERWANVQGAFVRDMLAEPGTPLTTWKELLRPVRAPLLAPLSVVYRNASHPPERSLATEILADFAADQPQMLGDLLMDADEKQFAVIFPKFKEHGMRGLPVLTSEFTRDRLATTVKSVWTVRFYRWNPGGQTKPANWDAVLQSPILDELKTPRLHFVDGSEPPKAPTPKVPGNYFALVATTEVMLGESEYDFTITFDDGVRVWLDNDIVFENWGPNSPTTKRVTLGHKPGKHNIKVEFFQAEGGYALDVETDIDHFHTAKRQANAAVALLRMGQPSKVWQMLQRSPDPTVRTFLIHRLGPLGADAKAIAIQLDKESDVTTRRALLLSLGEFSEKEFSPADRKALLPKLQDLYRTDADPGLHAASEWLLRQWKDEAWLKKTNKEWADDNDQQSKRLEEIKHDLTRDKSRDERRWYVNGQGQTLVVIPGPVEFWMGSASARSTLARPIVQQPQSGLAGTTWVGMETLPGYGKLEFQFQDGGRAAMIDKDGRAMGKYNQKGAVVNLMFGGVQYTGTIDGQKMSGKAKNGQSFWSWSLSQSGTPAASEDHAEGGSNEHWRRIGRSFAIASKEVTVEQFLRFRNDHPLDKRIADPSDCPVHHVLWYDAAAYCNWLSEREGIPREQWCYEPNEKGEYAEGMKMAPHYLQRTGYRLPTEAEWEYACRAGAVTRFSFGESEELLPKYAWYRNNSQNKSWSVGSLKPNDLGLFDMHGNAFEWCQDFQKPHGAGGDGKAIEDLEDLAAITNSIRRPMRGGSLWHPSSDARSTDRSEDLPTVRNAVYGFRPARTLPFRSFDRYAAARAAVLAAAGQAKGKPPLDDEAKANFRRPAVHWLKADLSDWSKVQPPRAFIARTLWYWQHDRDLAGIRDQAALAKLRPEEQKVLTHFWTDIAKLAAPANSAERVEFARVAALIAAGDGKDEPPFDNAAKAKLREQTVGWLKAELPLAVNRAGKARIIAAAAPLQGTLEKLAELELEDGQFHAELARHYADRGNNPLANAARAKALALFEKQLVKEPENRFLALDLADLLLIDTRWTVLTPAEMKTAMGATPTREQDGSIFVSGKPGAQETYTLDFKNIPTKIRGIRLEALRDDRLPQGGPGTNGGGNFVLSHFAVFGSNEKKPEALKPVPLRALFATFEERRAETSLTKEDINSGWSVQGAIGKSHHAIFAIDPYREGDDSSSLRIVLDFYHNAPALLGRFRLSVTSDDPKAIDQSNQLAAMTINEPWLKLAVAYALNGRKDKATEFFGKALQRTDGRAGMATVVAKAAPFPGMLEGLAASAPNDGPFQAELARHYAERGNKPLADAARTKARALYEAQLAKEPKNAALALELADLLLIDTRWTVLTPAEMKAEGGATLTKLQDQSILASGSNPPHDVYTLTFRNLPERIQALRLEVLTHESLPKNGPGRADNGNFTLTTIKAELDHAMKPGAARSLKFAHAWADFSQFERDVAEAIDANETSGWAIDHGGKPHVAVFQFAEPVAAGDGAVLRVTLEFKADAKYQLGRFRLAVSADPAAIEREQKLRAVLKFTDPWSRLGAAYALNGRNDKAIEYFGKAFKADPKFGDDRQAQHRYHAARAAVLAATRPGKDEPPLDDAAKAAVRGQASAWLKAELAAWNKVFESGPPQDRPAMVAALSAWHQDSELAGIRSAAALAKLPADEQKEWQTLWARVPDVRAVVSTSKKQGQKWRYTTNQPADGWQKAEFDDKQWQEGIGGFGSHGTPGTVVRTEWKTADIWLRREFTLPDGKWDDLLLQVHHDDQVEVYINGVLALKAPGALGNYEEMPLSAEALKALEPGKNVLAVRCHQVTGPQYIDVGIVAVKGNAGRLALAQIAFDRRRFALATQLWAEALASDPKLADDRLALHRARVALLAVAGQAHDETPPDDTAKASLRRQALDLLKAELAWLGQQLEKDRPGERAAVQAALLDWQKDGHLAGIRDSAALATLLADEQKACTRLWADVTALRLNAEGGANNTAFRLPGPGRPHSWMSQDRQGKWLAVPSADKVAVFDARTGELVRTLTGHTGRVYNVAFSPNGKLLAAGNSAGAGIVNTIKFWDVKTGAMTGTLDSFVGETLGVAFSEDGRHFFSSGPGGVQMWDLTTGRSVQTFKASGNTAVLYHPAVSPDGKRVICQDTPQTVKMWETEGDNLPVTLGGHTAPPQYSAYSPDGKWLATGSLNEVMLWDAATLKLEKKIATPANWLAFAPDGKSLLTAPHWNQALRTTVATRWDLATYEGKPLPPLTARTGWPVYHLSPDGKRLYSQVIDGPDVEQRIRVYDASTGADVEILPLQALAKRFPALLKGEDKPADNIERLDFARIAFDHKQFVFATRLWAEALAADPKLADESLTPHRYHAACAAALAAAGEGKDEPPLDDAAKAKLRGQALGWLKAEFADLNKVQPPQPFIARALWRWQQDADLVSIRDDAALAKLPVDEQKAFTQLWDDVAALMQKAGGFGAVPAAERVEEVQNELKRRNPGYDGALTHRIEDGVVTELNIDDMNVKDIAPVRFFLALKTFRCINGPLADLSPLKGMSLSALDVHGTKVRDLTPLKGMPLISLHLWHCTEVRDLAPLKGMALVHLDLNGCEQIKDIAPLRGMPLTSLYVNESQVRDLTPLKGMMLTFLVCNDTPVSDLSPLKGMPLQTLLIYKTGVADLTPLKGMPLQTIRLTPKNITQGLDVLRAMPSLRTIGTGWFDAPAWSPAEFWARHAKGEFKK